MADYYSVEAYLRALSLMFGALRVSLEIVYIVA